MNPVLEQRLRSQQARVRIRSWGYRQRDHAHGVWFNLRRLLTGARAAFVVDAADAAALVAEGHRLEPIGQALEPPKSIVIVPAERAARLPSARPVPVRLDRQLLEARHLVLTPFDDAAYPCPRTSFFSR